MGNSNLNISEFLRPWHLAGWSFFFNGTDIKTVYSYETTPENWPDPWKEFSKKVSPSAHLFISYYELGKDLSTQPCPERRSFWHKFITLCKLPKGSISFWPFVVFHNNSYNYQIKEFYKTLSFYSPPALIFFVNDDDKYLLQKQYDFFFKKTNTSPRIVYFSSLDKYLNASVDELHIVISQLKSVFR